MNSAFAARSLVVFLGIVFNFDLYHASDNLLGISLRCLAGFTGNAVLLRLCSTYKVCLQRMKLGVVGVYTLEVYASHVYVIKLLHSGSQYGLFTVLGFSNFLIGLFLTVLFTWIIIVTFKSCPVTNYLLYGKKKVVGPEKR